MHTVEIAEMKIALKKIKKKRRQKIDNIYRLSIKYSKENYTILSQMTSEQNTKK